MKKTAVRNLIWTELFLRHRVNRKRAERMADGIVAVMGDYRIIEFDLEEPTVRAPENTAPISTAMAGAQ